MFTVLWRQNYAIALQHPVTLDELNAASANFRKFVLTLVVDKTKRDIYMSSSFKRDYGPSFQVSSSSCVRKLKVNNGEKLFFYLSLKIWFWTQCWFSLCSTMYSLFTISYSLLILKRDSQNVRISGHCLLGYYIT